MLTSISFLWFLLSLPLSLPLPFSPFSLGAIRVPCQSCMHPLRLSSNPTSSWCQNHSLFHSQPLLTWLDVWTFLAPFFFSIELQLPVQTHITVFFSGSPRLRPWDKDSSSNGLLGRWKEHLNGSSLEIQERRVVNKKCGTKPVTSRWLVLYLKRQLWKVV